MKQLAFVIILLFSFHVAGAQTPTRLRLKQLELAPDSTEHVITSDTNRVAQWTPKSTLLFGYVTGSGTAGRVPRWTSSSALGDGVLRDDGTLLAINGVTVSGYSLYDYGTSSWRLPVGTTAQRPTAQTGAFRYNSTLGYSETYGASEWLQSDFPVGTNGYTIRYNNSTTQWEASSFLLNYGTAVGVNVPAGSVASTLHVRGGFFVEEAGTANDFFSLSGSTGFINFGNRGAGWGMATAANGSSDEDGSVLRFFPSTRYDDSGFTNIGFAFLGRINAAQTVNHTIFQIRDENTAAPTSGTSIRTYLEIFPQLNKSGSANLTGIGITINPTLTSYTDFYGINLSQSAGKAVYQSNTGATNHFAGNTIIGAVSTPAQTLHVAGPARITGSDGTPTTITGRDADGDIGNITVGAGLILSAGTLAATATGTVTGSGTTDYIPKFTSSTALGNSVLQESSSKIGIGVTPAHTLDMENATDAIDLPGGTTAQRPTNESELLRYNSDNARVEYADGTNWRNLLPSTSTTGSAILPAGTTGERDGSPLNGYIRYNSTTGQLEAYVQSAWANISASPRSYADMVSSGAAQYTVVSTEVIDTVTNIVASGFTHSNGVLTYTGTTNKNFLVNISAVVGEADTDAATAVLRLYQNSSIKGVSQMYCALQDEKYSMSISRIVTLATNDTLDCRLATGGDWIVSNFYFNVTPID